MKMFIFAILSRAFPTSIKKVPFETMPPKIPCLTFYNKKCIPVIGLGTYKVYALIVKRARNKMKLYAFKLKGEDGMKAVMTAIDVGYRHLDCAYFYCNEDIIGKAIAAKIKDKTIKREDLFLTGKLWNTFHNPKLVQWAMKKSLELLKTSYLDLYLMHSPMAYKEDIALIPRNANKKILHSDTDYVDTWKAMEVLVSKGLTRSIGVCNFNEKQLKRLLQKSQLKPVTNQVECHPYLSQTKLKMFCKNQGILITAYAPLGSPGMVKDKGPHLLKDTILEVLTRKYKKTPAQIALRYHIDSGGICVPKSGSKKRLLENIQIFDFALTPGDVARLDMLDNNTRFYGWNMDVDNPNYPFENKKAQNKAESHK